MGHTAPDWGIAGTTATIYRVDDLGELAARLWSPSTYDRSGNVIWMDDFEDGVNKWNDSGTGTGHGTAQSADCAHHGGYSCKVTTGDADGNRGTAYHVNPEPKVGKVGLEWWWALCEDPDYQYMNMIIKASEREYNIGWRWVFNSSSELWKIEYKDSDNNWVELVSGMDFWSGTRMFHSNKLVVDLVTEENVRFSMDGTDYDMSGIALNADDAGVEGYWETQFGLYTGENSSKSMYLDTVILTQNEP